MRIKGFILMVCLSVFFLLPGLNQAEQSQSGQKKGFALKLTGGMNYMSLGARNGGQVHHDGCK